MFEGEEILTHYKEIVTLTCFSLSTSTQPSGFWDTEEQCSISDWKMSLLPVTIQGCGLFIISIANGATVPLLLGTQALCDLTKLSEADSN